MIRGIILLSRKIIDGKCGSVGQSLLRKNAGDIVLNGPFGNEELARDLGIQQIQIQEIKNHEVGLKQVYMGLAVTYGDSIEIMNPIQSSDGFEFNLTTKMSKMISMADTLAGLGKDLPDLFFGGHGFIVRAVFKLLVETDPLHAVPERLLRNGFRADPFLHLQLDLVGINALSADGGGADHPPDL